MRKPSLVLWFASAGILVVVGALALTRGSNFGASALNESPLAPTVAPTVAPTELPPVGTASPDAQFTLPSDASLAAPGIPAIVPVTSVVPGQPTFTAENVLAYLASNPFPYADSQSQAPTIVDEIAFLTAAEAAQRIQHSIFRPDDALVCLVTLHGNFAYAGPVIDGKESVYRGHIGYIVFDAVTGNNIAEGIAP